MSTVVDGRRREGLLISDAEVLEEAGRLVETGVDRPDVARALAAAVADRSVLAAAHIEITRRMHHRPSDDVASGAVLRLVLAALALVPYSVVGEEQEGQATRRRRRRRG